MSWVRSPYKYKSVTNPDTSRRSIEELWDLTYKALGVCVEMGMAGADARVVLESMGVLPDFVVTPAPEEPKTTRPSRPGSCTHKKCVDCGDCHCKGKIVRSTGKGIEATLCVECREVRYVAALEVRISEYPPDFREVLGG